MRVDCYQCGAAYQIPDAAVTEAGVRTECRYRKRLHRDCVRDPEGVVRFDRSGRFTLSDVREKIALCRRGSSLKLGDHFLMAKLQSSVETAVRLR